MKTPLILLAFVVLLSGSAAAQEKPNPFTGNSAAVEQRLRLLEEKKLDAAIAQEELASEKATQERLRLRAAKTESAEVAYAESAKAPRARPVAAARVSVEPLGGAVAASAKSPRLVGSIATPSGWVALVEKDAEILNISEGETVKGLKASAITQQSATINGVAMRLEAVIARVMAPAAPSALNAQPRLAGLPLASPAPTLIPTEVIDLNAPAPSRK